MEDKLLILLKPSTGLAKVRLICFPFAGGGTSNYARWHKHLSDDVELYAFNLPGRERYFKKEFITSYHELIKIMSQEIAAIADRPLLFFGHSFGALSAYFTALELQLNHQIIPAHMIASARRPPDALQFSRIASLGNDEFLDHLINEYSGIPDIILNDPGMLSLFLPIIKSDFALYEQCSDVFAAYEAKKLQCHLTSINFNDDKVDIKEFSGWSYFTLNEYQHYSLPGGHFELLNDFSKLLDIINKVIEELKRS